MTTLSDVIEIATPVITLLAVLWAITQFWLDKWLQRRSDRKELQRARCVFLVGLIEHFRLCKLFLKRYEGIPITLKANPTNLLPTLALEWIMESCIRFALPQRTTSDILHLLGLHNSINVKWSEIRETARRYTSSTTDIELAWRQFSGSPELMVIDGLIRDCLRCSEMVCVALHGQLAQYPQPGKKTSKQAKIIRS
jgi:hypothetical protein